MESLDLKVSLVDTCTTRFLLLQFQRNCEIWAKFVYLASIQFPRTFVLCHLETSRLHYFLRVFSLIGVCSSYCCGSNSGLLCCHRRNNCTIMYLVYPHFLDKDLMVELLTTLFCRGCNMSRGVASL